MRALLTQADRAGSTFLSDELMKKLILWHRRLGHPSVERLKWTIKFTTGIDLREMDVENLPCWACDRTKIQRIDSNDAPQPATYVGEAIWIDMGELTPVSVEGHHFYSLITEEKARHRDFQSYTRKNEVQGYLKGYLNKMQTALTAVPSSDGPRRIRYLHLDGGREFGMSDLQAYCDNEGITIITSTPDNQYQNGKSERSIQLVKKTASAMALTMKVPSIFWNCLMSAAAFTLNRTGQSTVEDETPEQCLRRALEPERGTAVDNSILRIVGTRCVAYINPNHRVRSEGLDPHGARGIFLGYIGEHNYLVWLIDGSRYLKTPHVVFHETLGHPDEAPDPRDVVRSLPQHVQRRLRHRTKGKSYIRNEDNNVVNEDVTDDEGNVVRKRGRPKKKLVDLSSHHLVLAALEDHPDVLAACKQEGGCGDNAYESDCAPPMGNSFSQEGCPSTNPREISFREAMESNERQSWIEAMFREIQVNLDKGTLRFCHPSEAPDSHLIDAKWVLRKKYLSTGQLDKFKARVVARGFTQRKGIDYNETRASTARSAAWRILMALSALKGWYVYQIDFVAAYLNGDLRERIFMKQFPMLAEFFEARQDLARKANYCKDAIIELKNPLYGLKQAGAEWQRKAREIMRQFGFEPLKCDNAVYHNSKNGDVVASHVDDFLLCGPDKDRLTKLISGVTEVIEIDDLGEADWYLGVKIFRTSPTGDVRLDQQQYLLRTLEACGFTDSRSVATPFEPGMMTATEQYEGSTGRDETSEYAQIVGRYNFSAYILRPDISFAVSTWARFMSNPSPEHIQGVKRVPRYIKGTTGRGLLYKRNHRHKEYNELGLFGAVDSSFASCPDTAKSVTGYVFFMAGCPITWLSKLQPVVTRNTTDAEYVAVNEAAGEAAWIRNFLEELCLMPKGPITILEDNTGAIDWVCDPSVKKKARHIRVAYHYVRQEIVDGHIEMEFVESAKNPADGFTKPLYGPGHTKFIEMLGMVDIED